MNTNVHRGLNQISGKPGTFCAFANSIFLPCAHNTDTSRVFRNLVAAGGFSVNFERDQFHSINFIPEINAESFIPINIYFDHGTKLGMQTIWYAAFDLQQKTNIAKCQCDYQISLKHQ